MNKTFLIEMAGRLPSGVRAAIHRSPLGRLIHRALNTAIHETIAVVPLHGPLAGHRMRLDVRRLRGMAYGDYEPAVTRLIQRTVQSGWTVADIGAQIGYMTLLLAQRVGPAGHVYAFEPLSANYQTLRENVALNHYSTIQVERLAVSNQTGRVRLHTHDDQTLSFTASLVMSSDKDATPTVDVDAVRLDDYLIDPDTPLHFAKIDVEGAESLVIDGMRQTLDRWRPTLLIEIHPLGDQPNPTLPMLQTLGYTCLAVHDDGTTSPAPPDFLGHSLALPF